MPFRGRSEVGSGVRVQSVRVQVGDAVVFYPRVFTQALIERRLPVTGAIAPLDDLNRWARGDLLEIMLLVLGAILLTRLAEWARDRIVAHIDARAREADELVRSEAAKHRHVVAQVVTWAFLALVYVVTAVLVVQRLGVPLAGLVAPALCSARRWGSACSGSSRTSGPGSSSPPNASTGSATSSGSG